MRIDRRRLLTGGSAAALASLAPIQAWASAGAPSYLAAMKTRSGGYSLVGVRADGSSAFRLPLPDRGHAAAAHPTRPEAVAFARRPGVFALVVDCAEGRVTARLTPPEGRRFYGHGVFSADARLLYTTENAFEEARGVIGVWDASDGYKRLGEFDSGGVGPHDVVLSPDGAHLIVANGGIETHPDSGRAKLNIPTMRTNLAVLRAGTGALEELNEPPEAWRQNSIRHLSVRTDGLVAAACQWEGAPLGTPPLLVLYDLREKTMTFLAAPLELQRETRNYAGSVSFSGDENYVAYTAPRGGLALAFGVDAGSLADVVRAPDICGVARSAAGLRYTTGEGRILDAAMGGGAVGAVEVAAVDGAFDNHLVSI